jgi:hypothetical protein
MILGIDPGPKQSAYVVWNWRGNMIHSYGILDNNDFLFMVRNPTTTVPTIYINPAQLVEPLIPVIEMVQSFGMPVGKEIFETVLLVGRLVEIFAGEAKLVYRKDIKIHFCQTNRANDANIRRVLIDRFGEPGTKKNKGMLYGIKKDSWSALAVAVYYADTMPK